LYVFVFVFIIIFLNLSGLATFPLHSATLHRGITLPESAWKAI
jgi:hypothetical protein